MLQTKNVKFDRILIIGEPVARTVAPGSELLPQQLPACRYVTAAGETGDGMGHCTPLMPHLAATNGFSTVHVLSQDMHQPREHWDPQKKSNQAGAA